MKNTMDYIARPSIVLPLAALVLSTGYLVFLAAYRIFFHPLAKFPGPTIAALTKWYEFYYDVTLQGQFTVKIQELHSHYGPIVRITPDEVHVMDSDYWETLYSQSSKFDKYEWMASRFQNNGSVFTTSSHDLHRLRWSALSSHFSRRSIIRFQPMIREKLEILFKAIEDTGKNGGVVDMKKAWAAFTGDVICQYAFGWSYNHTAMPDFGNGGFHDAYMAAGEFGMTVMQFPSMSTVSFIAPDPVLI